MHMKKMQFDIHGRNQYLIFRQQISLGQMIKTHIT